MRVKVAKMTTGVRAIPEAIEKTLNGTTGVERPARLLNNSADRWMDVPLPELATFSLPGLPRAAPAGRLR